MKRIAWKIVKTVFLAGFLGFMIMAVIKNDIFKDLWHGPKNWFYILLGLSCYFVSVGVTFTRWFFLVRAVGIPVRLLEAIRIAFLALFVSMLPMGAIVGGDLFKAWMLGKVQTGKGAENLASIMIDRFFGLFAMFFYVTVAACLSGISSMDDVVMQRLFMGTLVTTLGFAALAVILLFCPDAIIRKMIAFLGRIPYLGGFLQRLTQAIRYYRSKPWVLALAFFMGMVSQTFLATSLHLFGIALFEHFHSYAQNLAIIPLCIATIFIPVAIGPLEVALDWFYTHTFMDDGSVAKSGVGFVVALGFRLYVLGLAGCGWLYYVFYRPTIDDTFPAELLDETGYKQD